MSLPKTNRISSQFNLISALAALIVGGLIYLFARPVEPLFFRWFAFLSAENWLTSVRQLTVPFFYNVIPDWILFSLPAGLWAFAYSIVIILIWKNSNSILKYLWFTTIPLIVLGVEFFQYLKIINGAFCRIDLAFGLAGIFAGYLVGYKQIKT